jgi:hypothetical protein
MKFLIVGERRGSMRVSLKMLLVGLAVVVGLFAGPAWGQERDIEKELGIHIDKVLEGSEEIKPGEDMGGAKPRAIYSFLFVANYRPSFLYISRGSSCGVTLGIAAPAMIPGVPNITPLFVGDWQGDTKLCAQETISGNRWKQTVKGGHATYRWNIR